MKSNDATSENMRRSARLGALGVAAAMLSGCTGTVTVAGNVASMLVVLVLLWSTITMNRG
jgi:hypothetical protein